MNYRHAYHAGNFADVHKHVFLQALISYLQKKDTGLCIMDSHAGRGYYDLADRESQKTLEFLNGVSLLLKSPVSHPWLIRYQHTISHWRNEQQLVQGYPGSPVFSQQMLRTQDHLVLFELEEHEAQCLKHWARAFPRCSMHQRDAWEGLNALLPPANRRGLVLIDPPYETPEDSTAALLRNLDKLLHLWPLGVYLLWIPIKDIRDLRHLQSRLERHPWPAPIKEFLLAELCLHTPDTTLGLNGSALLLINPPWQFATEAESCQAELWKLLSTQQSGHHLVRLLKHKSL